MIFLIGLALAVLVVGWLVLGLQDRRSDQEVPTLGRFLPVASGEKERVGPNDTG